VPRPVVTEAAEELYVSLGPWSRADEALGEDGGWQLLHFCEAAVGQLQPLLDVISDTEDGIGWSIVLDVERAPAAWLPWLGQFVGVTVDPVLDEAGQRAQISSLPGTKRGSPGSIAAAAQRYLTGTGTVYLIERHGSPWRLTVAMLTGEAAADIRPQLEAAVRALKPAGIVMAVRYILGSDYDSLRDTHASYDEILTLYTDYNDVLSDPTRRP
jgi:hypothetical protein